MSCSICEHIQAEREKVKKLIADLPEGQFNRKAGLLSLEADWDNAWDMHRVTCQEVAA